MSDRLVTHDIGEATLEVFVPSKALTVGENTNVEVRLSGESDVEIGAVTLALEVRYRTENGYREITLERYQLATELSIESGLIETRQTPISIPYALPSTYGCVDVLAKLEIETDRDIATREEILDVEPTDRFQTVFDAMIDLGFALRNGECREDHSSDGGPFVQQFDFQPTAGAFEGDLETVELFVRTGPDEVTLFVAVDREADGLAPIPETDNSKMVVRQTEPGPVRDDLQSVIDRNLRA